MKLLLTMLIMCCYFTTQAQFTLKAIITGEQHSALTGASISWKEGGVSFAADSTGMVVINNIPPGKQTFLVSHTGFAEQSISYDFPLENDRIITIIMEPETEEEEEVIISATRTSRTISNSPTRVEVISGEELDEKSNMKPGDIRMLLNESTGIQTQQTSATSYNSSIRIQGLDGRYTQVLKDGYPLYAGFSGGLSIMQVAPLDLHQVEVIKGSSSTLYGGGAIAGLVNLVSKTPGDKKELSFIANGTSAKGLDLSSFYSQRFNKFGVTLFGSANYGSPYDPASNGFTAIPSFERYTINPRLFFFGKKTAVNAGFSYITEDRTGGSIDYIKNGGTGYFEKNNSDRFSTQAGIRHQLGETSSLQFKNSYSRFKRLVNMPAYLFEGLQQSSFSELTWNTKTTKHQWVTGLNFLTDDFEETVHYTLDVRDYHYNTVGIFVQDTWSPSGAFTMETGLRADHVKQYGWELLPRISALYKFNSRISMRVGGGLGYKTPTVFNEEAERLHYQDILPMHAEARNERSAGGNIDVNYKTLIGQVGFSINQLFFYSRLRKPLVLTAATSTTSAFKNADGHIDSKGIETNIKFTYDHFKLFLGYTYADVNSHFNQEEAPLPLTAKHRINTVLMYEVEERLKLGLEAYYTSRQHLTDGRMGKAYWITGFMAEKLWESFSLFINFENFTDTRQTRFESIYTGTMDNPVFRDIYAPVDGFVVNGGIKIKF